jgi:hypothetical protein
MTKREQKYQNKKKMTREIVKILRVNIRASINDEIIKKIMAMEKGEIDIPVDLIPFNINDIINY